MTEQTKLLIENLEQIRKECTRAWYLAISDEVKDKINVIDVETFNVIWMLRKDGE